MKEWFVTSHQQCELCDSDILIGYECFVSKDGYFCSEECMQEHLYEGSDFQEVYLTNNKLYREV